MARVLKSALPARTGGHRTEKYSFTEWFTPNGKGAYPVIMLVQGEDYSASHASMRSSLKGAAEKRGLNVATRQLNAQLRQDNELPENAEGLVFQAFTKEDKS